MFKARLILVFLLYAFFVNAQQQCESELILTEGKFHNGYAYPEYGSLIFDDQNNFYATGAAEYFLAKYTKDGKLLWKVSDVSHNKGSNDLIREATLKNNVLYITSWSDQNFYSKYDTTGKKIFSLPITEENLGAFGMINPFAIGADDNANVYVIIEFRGAITIGNNTYKSPDAGGADCALIKFNNNGNIQWSKHIVTGGYGTSSTLGFAMDNNFIYISGAMTKFGDETNTQGASKIIKCRTSDGGVEWFKSRDTYGYGTIALMNSEYILFQAYGSQKSTLEVWNTSGDAVTSIQLPVADQNYSISTYGKEFAIQFGFSLSNTPNTHSMAHVVTGHIDSSKVNLTKLWIPVLGTNNQHLLNFNKDGDLYGFYSVTNDNADDTAYIDLRLITTTASMQRLLVKYDNNYRVMPVYSSAVISCGEKIKLGEGSEKMPTYNPEGITWTPTLGLSDPRIPFPVAQPKRTTTYKMVNKYGCTREVTVTVDNPSNFSYSTTAMVANFTINNPACSSFIWDFGNGNTSTINPNPTVTYLTPGTYGVCLKCNDQPAMCVECLNVTVPSNTSGSTTSIKELNNNNLFSVFPNPTSGLFTIENKNFNSVTTRYVLLNILGQEIKQDNLYGPVNTINIQSLPKGIYFLHIGNQEVQTIKLIKI